VIVFVSVATDYLRDYL